MSVTLTDHVVPTAMGNLFARRWSPAAPKPEPIILQHDSLGCAELWRDFPEALAAATDRCVIAYDRLGFGRSDPHPDRLSSHFVQEEAKSGLWAIRRAFEVEQMVLAGHSVGGGMAIAGGAAYSDCTTAIITMSAQAFVEDRTIASILEAKTKFAQPGQIERLARYHGDKARWVLDAWIETWLAPDFRDWSLDSDLPQIRCPLLVMHGDLDEYGSEAHPDRIAALAEGDAIVEMFEQCGHVPWREKRDQVLASARRFLAKL